jgi:hypothetical protein
MRLIMPLVMLIALLANPGSAAAFNANATDAAFAALLSMPEAKPETGSWDFPAPEDYRAKNETDLIAYLDKQKRKGADFNAYRHFGTLLHHAIRAKLSKTALWLLDQGTDPRKILLNGTEDALTLSVQYKQHNLAKVLRDKYGLTTPSVVPPAQAAMPKPSKQVDMADFDKLRSALYAVYEDSSQPRLSDKSLRALAAWEASLHAIPDNRYVAQMDYDDSMILLVQAYSRTPDALDKALAKFPVAMLQRHSTALVGGLAGVSNINLPAGQSQARYIVPEQSWRVLWRRIRQQVDYTQILAPPSAPIRPVPLSTVAGRIQPSLWDELYASGYQEHHAKTALGCLLNAMDVPSFKKLWPTLPKYFPDIREAAPEMLLSPYRLSVYGETRAELCYGSLENNGLTEKLVFLSSQGVTAKVIGLSKGTLKDQPTDLLAAIEPFIDHAEHSSEKPRLVDATESCHFVLTPLIRNALLNNPVIPDGLRGVLIQTVQSIEIPGETQCGLLVMGDQRVDPYVSGDYDSFTGPDTNPRASCPDPIDSYEIWFERGGKIEKISTDLGDIDYFQSSLSLVQDSGTGISYYLRNGPQPSNCRSGNSLPIILKWQKSGAAWALKVVTDHDAVNALYKQCYSDDNRYVLCKGIQAFEPDRQDYERRPANLPDVSDSFVYDLPTFIKVFRKPEYEAYLNAVMSLDKSKLRELQQTGIPGSWTAEAIVKVGESHLTLGEKRKRVAWLFFDHVQLEKALAQYTHYYPGYNVIESLVPWLPEEDWRPILNIAAKYGSTKDYGLGYIRSNVAERGMKKLACGIDNAHGLICGETWSTGQ